MRKLICTVMSACMAFAFMVPSGALASEPTEEQAAESTGADSYTAQSFSKLYEASKIVLPGSVSDVEESAAGKGILVTLPKKYAGEKFVVDQDFDFGEGEMSCFSFNGLAERNTNVEVSFFLDDEAEPFTTTTMKRTSGKTDWVVDGEQTGLTASKYTGGPHKLSFSFNATGSKRQVLLRSFCFMQQDLPLVEFDIDEQYGTIEAMNSSPDHSRECYGNMVLHIPAGYESDYGDFTVPDGSTTTYPMEYIRGRGNSTWDASKKPYKVKLDSKADLLGMGASKHWVLIANRYDNTLLRNKMTYWIGDQLGTKFTPQCMFVDVVMNGSYLGSYYLSEQIRVGDSRVEIEELSEDDTDITGGYLLNMDAEDSAVHFVTDDDVNFTLEEPEFEGELSEAQAKQLGYIKSYVQAMEDAIYGEDFKNEAGKHYTDYFDVDAAVDYYWMQMISMNNDAWGGGSTYAYKNRDGLANDKFNWGPLWDFDYVAWGNLEYSRTDIAGFRDDSAPWLVRLKQDDAFMKKMRARWDTIRELLVEITREGGKLDQWEAQLEISQHNDNAKWGSFHPNENEEKDVTPTTYAGEIDQLRNWINARVSWIDENIDNLTPTPATVTFKDGDEVISTLKTAVGAPLRELPEIQPREGYFFLGWFGIDEDGEETEYTAGEMIRVADLVLSAKWVKQSEASLVKIVNFLQHDLALEVGGESMNILTSVYPEETDDASLTWTSSDKSVATVDEFGCVEPVSPGTATITATAIGGAHDSATVTVYDPEEYDPWGRFEGFTVDELTIPKGSAAVIPCTFTEGPQKKIMVIWGVLDQSVASVDDTGLVCGLETGTTYVIASCYEDLSDIAVCKVNVVSDNLKDAKVKLSKTAFAYTGKAAKPKVKSVKIGGMTLTEGTDFTVSYAKGRKNVGTYTVTLNGKGAFSGKRTVKFQVVPPKAKLAKAKKSGNKVLVEWKKFTGKKAKQMTGWQVMTASNKKFTKNKKTVTAGKKKTQTTVKKAGKKTFVKVRAYKTVKGKKIYGNWSKVMTA